LVSEKNLARKALVSPSQVVIDHGGNEWSHAGTLSFSEKGNKEGELCWQRLHWALMYHTPQKVREVWIRSPLGHNRTVPDPPWLSRPA